jgi:RNA polymerase sigma factor (sigma-70 family)
MSSKGPKMHLPLVYSAARRQVRSPQLAEEVAQLVFTDLARQAARLKPDTVLAAWLYRVTRRRAADLLRCELRWRKGEQIGVELAAMNSTSSDWVQVEPLLDEAIAKLNEAERSAIIVRYFENKNLREVGQAFGISEDAAQKRVSRALERLRLLLGKRGLAVSASSLALLVSVHAVQAAPAGMAASLATSCAAQAAGTAGYTLFYKLLLMTKTKTALFSVVLVAAIGPTAFLHHQRQLTLEENVRLLQRQSELMASNTRLLEQVTTLESQTQALEQTNRFLRLPSGLVVAQGRAAQGQAPRGVAALGTAGQPDSEPGVIRLRKENLSRVQFEALNEKFELTETAKDLVQITPEESGRIAAALQEFKERIHAHDLAAVRQVPIEEVKDEDIVRFLKGTPGQATIFQIPPFRSQEQQALQEWFRSRLEENLGSERSQVLTRNAKVSLDFWLGGTEDKLVAFVDQVDSGNSFLNNWMIKFNTPSSHGTYSGGARDEAVPPHLKYLFDIHQPAKH